MGFWRWYLLLWFLPLVTLLQAILRLRAVMEHGAVDDTTTPLKAARTNFVPPYLYWILFPHDVHYHIEHHLYPSIPIIDWRSATGACARAACSTVRRWRRCPR